MVDDVACWRVPIIVQVDDQAQFRRRLKVVMRAKPSDISQIQFPALAVSYSEPLNS